MAELIEDLLHRRTDLSTFLVHLTRTDENRTARERLLSMLKMGQLTLGQPLGMASALAEAKKTTDSDFYRSQQVICFTETPLEHTWMMCRDIANRQIQFQPYGLAFTKTWARKRSANPVWYLDITPGHDWLTEPIRRMVQAAESAGILNADIFHLTPFIEQMGPTSVARKEFWWEREWRRAGWDLLFSPRDLVAVLVPEDEHDGLRDELASWLYETRSNPSWFDPLNLIDPRWGMERIVAHLAGVRDEDVGPFPS